MSFDQIRTASIIRFPYLWAREAERGETEGRKTRPVAVGVRVGKYASNAKAVDVANGSYLKVTALSPDRKVKTCMCSFRANRPRPIVSECRKWKSGALVSMPPFSFGSFSTSTTRTSPVSRFYIEPEPPLV